MPQTQLQQRSGRRVQSVRRNHSNRHWSTLQTENVNAYITGSKAFTDASNMNNTIVAEPRFKMYN